MDDETQSRFLANVKWFDQFFSGIRQLYGIVVETLPTEFFPENFALKSTNFYFPRQNWAPTMPPYYVLMVEGRQFALQVLAVFDPDVFGTPGLFVAEPSLVVVLHSQENRAGYINDYALRVIGNRGIEISPKADDSNQYRGKINVRPPANFFSFQVPFDKFSADQNSHDAVRKYIADPIIEYLEDR